MPIYDMASPNGYLNEDGSLRLSVWIRVILG